MKNEAVEKMYFRYKICIRQRWFNAASTSSLATSAYYIAVWPHPDRIPIYPHSRKFLHPFNLKVQTVEEVKPIPIHYLILDLVAFPFPVSMSFRFQDLNV